MTLDADVMSLGFEGDGATSAVSIVKQGATTWRFAGSNPADVSWAHADEGALEGGNVLELAHDRAVAVRDQRFDALATKKVVVSVWTRARGAEPSALVTYGSIGVAGVRLIPTGRATSDGWVELSTGVIDGAIDGTPIHAVVLATAKDTKGSALFDALEVSVAPGEATAPKACGQADEEVACGADGECMFGRCVPSTALWSALPPRAAREELLQRWSAYATTFMGDRAAAERGKTEFATRARALVDAASARDFYRGLQRLVHQLGDAHTSLGWANYSNWLPTTAWPISSSVGGCFMLAQDDRGSGERVYVVNATTGSAPATSAKLERGDVLVSIDGEPAQTWLDRVWPMAASGGNDPRARPARIGPMLADLLTRKAGRFAVDRCKAGTDCSAQNRTRVEIDVRTKALDAQLAQDSLSSGDEIVCSARVIDAVAGYSSSLFSGGMDAVFKATSGNTTSVQFDGFNADDSFSAHMHDALADASTKLLIDARVGNGGSARLVISMVQELRGNDDPWGQLMVPRGRVDVLDPDWLVPEAMRCKEDSAAAFCMLARSVFAYAPAPAANKKVAWLNTVDVSGNDFAPRLLRGRKNFRIFAPVPTEGAFGGVVAIPALLPGWTSGSIQIQDSRIASTADGFATARWESGHGVEPDEEVVQKLSDLLVGKDTLLVAAQKWLAE